jgi:hypothetical protein
MQGNELSAQQRREIEFWRDSVLERPDSDSIENLVNKANDAGILLDLLHRYERDFPEPTMYWSLAAVRAGPLAS